VVFPGRSLAPWCINRSRAAGCFLLLSFHSLPQHARLPASATFLSSLPQVCNVLTAVILASGCSFLYLLTWGLRELAALQPPLLYTSLLVLLLFPGSLLFRDSRLFFAGTLWRVFTPLRPVSWADFLLADVLTSLAKALSDTERAVCSMMTGPVLEPNQQVSHTVACGSPAERG
jgi:hypothetical protein